MGHSIEIDIIINNMLISELHETISSILEQTNLSGFDISILFINRNNLNIQEELHRLANTPIHIIEKPSNARFILTLYSGDIISRSYIYKGYHYLINNESAFVCPEYTFRRVENSLIIATIQNDQMLINHTSANLVDRAKIQSNCKVSPRASIVKDTCSASGTIYENFCKYIRKIKDEKPFFNSPLFHPSNLTNLSTPSLFSGTTHISTKQKIASLLKASAGRSRIIKALLKTNQNEKNEIHSQSSPYISTQMRNELEHLSSIKYSLKGYLSMKFIDITYETFSSSEQLLSSLSLSSSYFTFNDYSYIMLLPWLISGGIDLFAVNYLNTIAELYPDQHILAILTNEAHHSFSHEELGLASNVTLIDLPSIFGHNNKKQYKYLAELLYSIINVYQPKRLHVVASKAGYDCVIKYGDTIRSNKTTILFSSYNYLVGPHNEYIGYSVIELPLAYRPGDVITTDNSISRDLWVNHFGFNKDDILIHHQLLDYPKTASASPTSKNGINILWAAHVRPEKNPVILPAIAQSLQSDKIDIDCYGLFTPQNWEDEENPLETGIANLHYKGPYRDFFRDIDLSKYDLFLYTSHADGTPNVIIEAAIAGLPIVSSSVGGIPNALGQDATLVDDSHSVEKFVNAIRSSLSNIENSRNKAKALQKKLVARHDKRNFINQVKEMLKRSEP